MTEILENRIIPTDLRGEMSRSLYKYVIKAIALMGVSNLVAWLVMVTGIGRSLTCHYSNQF